MLSALLSSLVFFQTPLVPNSPQHGHTSPDLLLSDPDSSGSAYPRPIPFETQNSGFKNHTWQDQPLYRLTATEAHTLLANDSITVTSLCESIISRVRARNSTVKAWSYFDTDLILAQARRLDEVPLLDRGPLHGIPVAIKDIMNTNDMPTSYGSDMYTGHRPESDASAVAIFRRAGAVILGKTTLPEFAMLNHGPATTNPHDVRRTPGGSSTGSAAAVADFQAIISTGTQCSGSTIRPASYNGIYAMKPTRNVVSGEGIKESTFTLDTYGFFARSLDDIALVAETYRFHHEFEGVDGPGQGFNDLSHAQIAFVKTPMWRSVGADVHAAWRRAESILVAAGAHVHHVSLPSAFDGMTPADFQDMHTAIADAEAQSTMLNVYLDDPSGIHLSPYIRGIVENRANITYTELIRSRDPYSNLRFAFDSFASNYTVVVTPSASGVAPLGLGYMGDPSTQFLWTGLNVPVIHVPFAKGEENGMPVGLSFVQARYRDLYLVNAVRTLAEPLMKADGGWEIDIPRPRHEESIGLRGGHGRAFQDIDGDADTERQAAEIEARMAKYNAPVWDFKRELRG